MSTGLDDREIERLLRATFDSRAETVSSGPGLDRSTSRAFRGTRRTVRWLAPLAAAAAVAAVVASVVAIENNPRTHDVAPATQRPTDRHPASTPPPTTPTPGPRATVCTTSLPAAWRVALGDAALPAGGRTADALSVAPDGSVLAIRDDGVHPGDGRDVVQLRQGRSPTLLYSVPNPDQVSVRQADVYDHWLVVGLIPDARPKKGVIPGDSPNELQSIVVVDLAGGDSRTLAATGPDLSAPVISSEALLDGTVYWDERSSYDASRGVVKSYDLRSGVTRTVYHGPDGYLDATPTGVQLGTAGKSHTIHATTLPAPVSHALTRLGRTTLTTDETVYAWIASIRTIGWWAPGHDAPVYRRLARPISQSASVLVAGRFVIVLNSDRRGRTVVVDMVAGATAPLPDAAFGGLTRPDLYVAHDGVLAGLAFVERAGHWVDGYWADAARTPLRIDTTTLPPLGC